MQIMIVVKGYDDKSMPKNTMMIRKTPKHHYMACLPGSLWLPYDHATSRGKIPSCPSYQLGTLTYSNRYFNPCPSFLILRKSLHAFLMLGQSLRSCRQGLQRHV